MSLATTTNTLDSPSPQPPHPPHPSLLSPSKHVYSKSLADPISLSLKPPPPPTKGHRHRRSAAISGDFDSPSSFLQNLQSSSISSPSIGYDKFINDFSNQSRRNSTNTNSLQLNLSFPSLSVPTSPIKTENTVSQADPLINLDDIINLSSPIPSKSAPQPSPINNIPKFQLQSPKTEIIIFEEEQLELNSINNTNSFSLDYTSNNSSTNSLLNQSPNPLTNLNTSSINSLKGKVRYQSYYNMAAPSTPKNYHNSTFIPITPSTPSTPKHSSNNHPHRFNHQRLNHSTSMSPVKSSIKSPFQYKSKPYDISSQDESPLTIHSQIHSHNQSPNSSSTSTSTISFISSNESKDNKTSKSQNDLNSLSTESNNTKKFNTPLINVQSHNRSSSLFSLLSKKFNSNHNRKTSIISNFSTTKDESSLIINDSTLNLNDVTITPDTLGEPGPMIDILSKDSNNLSLSPHNSVSNIPKRKNNQLKSNSSSKSNSKSKSTSSKHRFISWLSKSKRQSNSAS